ncbi:hypothetical protein BASA62_007155 [Batrachochytrium salamandrivorans]|nr:hypothetical protein BASA62_007155 [Batrachochytrium salamandrivorans]
MVALLITALGLPFVAGIFASSLNINGPSYGTMQKREMLLGDATAAFEVDRYVSIDRRSPLPFFKNRAIRFQNRHLRRRNVMLERRSPGFFRSGFTNAAIATVASLPFDTNPT